MEGWLEEGTADVIADVAVNSPEFWQTVKRSLCFYGDDRGNRGG